MFRVERETTDLHGRLLRHEVCYGLTSLSTKKAGPDRLLDLNRGHWEIENRLHWVRDVTFDEDRSQVRRHNGPQVMASLRNAAIGLLRLAGATNIASATRHLHRKVGKALRLIGL